MKLIAVWTAVALMEVLMTPRLAHAQSRVPQFQVEPFWPKPLPNNWILGQVSGIATDRNDRIWVVHRPTTLTRASERPSRSRQKRIAVSLRRRFWCSTSPVSCSAPGAAPARVTNGP